MTLEEINTTIRQCTNCVLCKLECNKQDKAKGFGKLLCWNNDVRRCKYLIVGMNPSRKRFPGIEYVLSGTSENKGTGSKFVSLLRQTGFFEEICCTNLVKCSSETNKINQYYVKKCFDNFVKEITFLQPKKIICLGQDVYKFLNINILENNIQIAVDKIYHPSFVFRYNKIDLENYKNSIINACKGEN